MGTFCRALGAQGKRRTTTAGKTRTRARGERTKVRASERSEQVTAKRTKETREGRRRKEGKQRTKDSQEQDEVTYWRSLLRACVTISVSRSRRGYYTQSAAAGYQFGATRKPGLFHP